MRAPFDSATAEIIQEAKPPIVSFHFGLPDGSLLDQVKDAYAKIYSSATTVAEAKWLEGRGVDAIIAQGAEAGGHRGMFLTEDIGGQPGLFALLPQIVDAVRVPVIAAGASRTGRNSGCFCAGRFCHTDWHRVPVDAPVDNFDHPSRSASEGKRRIDSAHHLFTGRPARGISEIGSSATGRLTGSPSISPRRRRVSPLRAFYEKRGPATIRRCGLDGAALGREEDAGALTTRLWSEAKAVLAAVCLTP